MEKYYLSFYDVYDSGEDIWFSNNLYNGLFRYNIADKKTYFVSFFENEEKNQRGLHQKVVHYKGKLFFLPGLAKHIHVVDLRNCSMKSINVAEQIGSYADASLSCVYMKDNWLYVFPKDISKQLYRMDLETLEITTEKGFKSEISNCLNQTEGKFCYKPYQEDEMIWFPVLKTNKVLKYSIVGKKFELYELEISNAIAMEKYNNSFWLLVENGRSVYQWDGENKEVKEYLLPDFPMEDVTQQIQHYKDMLFVFLKNSSIIYILQENQFVVWNAVGNCCRVEHNCASWATFAGISEGVGRVFMNQFATDKCIWIKEDGEIEFHEIFLNMDQNQLMLWYDGTQKIYEKTSVPLELFMEWVDTKPLSETAVDKYVPCGEKIFESCIE